MKFNLLIIIIIVIIIYISCYFIFPPSVQILQTTISDFTFATLHMRQPIVITDYLQEKKELIDTWFKYNLITEITETKDGWIHNKYKYLFINANNDTEVIIYKASIYKTPPNENDRIIAIKLQKDQSLILPYRWKYFIDNPSDISCWGVHDIPTFFVSFVF